MTGASPTRAVQDYLDAIPPIHRPFFDRLDQLIRQLHPDVEQGIAYAMPYYQVGERRLIVGVWKRWVSLYGQEQGQDAFAARHPELKTSKGTIQLPPAAAAAITDDDFRGLIRDALG